MARQTPTTSPVDERAQVQTDFDTFFLPFNASLDLTGTDNANDPARTVYGVTDPEVELSMVNIRHLNNYTKFRGTYSSTRLDGASVDNPVYEAGDIVVGSNNVIYQLMDENNAGTDPGMNNTGWTALGILVEPNGVTATNDLPGIYLDNQNRLNFRAYTNGNGIDITNNVISVRNMSITDVHVYSTRANWLAGLDNDATGSPVTWHEGDIAIVNSTVEADQGTFIYINSTPSTGATTYVAGATSGNDWTRLALPGNLVNMVAGLPGPTIDASALAGRLTPHIDLDNLNDVSDRVPAGGGLQSGTMLEYDDPNSQWVQTNAPSIIESWALTTNSTTDIEVGHLGNVPILNWITGTTYNENDLVVNNGIVWRALRTIPSGDRATAPAEGMNWAEIGASLDSLNELEDVEYEGTGSHTGVTRYTQLLDTENPSSVVTEPFSNFGTPRININSDGNTVVRVEDFGGTLQYAGVNPGDPNIAFDTASTNNYVVFVAQGQTPSATNRVTTTIPYRLIAFSADDNTITLQGSAPRALWGNQFDNDGNVTVKGIGDSNVYVAVSATTVAANPTQGQVLTWNSSARGGSGAWINEDPEHIMANQNLHDLQDVDNEVAGNEMLLRNAENTLWESIPISDDDASVRTVARQINLEHLADVNETEITMTAVFSPVNNREGSIEEVNVVVRSSQQDSIRHGTDPTDRPLDVTMINANDDVVWFSTLSEGFTGTQGTNGVDRFGPYTIEEVETTSTTSFIRIATLLNRAAINAGTFYAWTSRNVPTGGIREGDVLGWVGNATTGSWQNIPVANLAFSATNLDAFDDVTYDDDVFQTIFTVALAEDTRAATNMVTLNTPTANVATGNQESTLFANRDLNINFEAGDFSAGDQVYFSTVTPPVGQSFTRRGPYTVDRVVNNNPVFIIGSGAGQITTTDRGNVNATPTYAYIAVPSSTTVRPGDVLVRSADGSTWVNETADQMAANPNGGIQLESLRDVNRVHEQEEVLTPTATGVTVTSATLQNAATMRLAISGNIAPVPAVGSLLRFAGRTEIFEVLTYTPNFDVVMRDSSLIPPAFADGLTTSNPEISTLVSTMRDIPLADNEILAYNNTDNTWRNQTPGEAGLVSQINLFDESTVALRPTEANNGVINLPLATDALPGLMSDQDVRTIEEFPDEAPTSTDGMARTMSNTIAQGAHQDFALRVERKLGNDGTNADESDSYTRTWQPIADDEAGVEHIRLDGESVDLMEIGGRVTIPLADSSTPGVINSGNYDRLVSLPQTPTTTDGTSGGTTIADGANQEFGLRVSRTGANYNQVWVPLTEQDRLEFTEDQSTATLTGYRNEAGVLETVQDTDMVSYDSTNPNRQRLQLTLASFPTNPAAGFSPVTLRWDQPYSRAQSMVGTTQIGVSANNPTDFSAQYLDELTTVTADSGNTGISLSSFTGAPSVTPAGGVPWFQRLTLNDGQFLRDSNTGLTGGVTTVTYTLTDNLDNTYMTTQTFTWDTPNVDTFFGSYPTDRQWYERIDSIDYTTRNTGMANGDDISTNWTQSSNAFSNIATALGTNSPGFNFNNRTLNFTTPYHRGLQNQGTITATATYSRPADVTGTSYTATDTHTIPIPSPIFEIPNLTRFVTNMNALTIGDFFTGDFSTGRGLDLATGASNTFMVGANTENDLDFTGANRFYWFGFPATQAGITFTDVRSNLPVAQQTPQTLTFSANALNNTSGISNVPTGLTTITYTFYGILLNAGTNRIRITL